MAWSRSPPIVWTIAWISASLTRAVASVAAGTGDSSAAGNPAMSRHFTRSASRIRRRSGSRTEAARRATRSTATDGLGPPHGVEEPELLSVLLADVVVGVLLIGVAEVVAGALHLAVGGQGRAEEEVVLRVVVALHGGEHRARLGGATDRKARRAERAASAGETGRPASTVSTTASPSHPGTPSTRSAARR